jgi:PA14 domain-containing protein
LGVAHTHVQEIAVKYHSFASAALILASVLCSKTSAASGVFQIINTASARSPIDNIAEANGLLSGQLANKGLLTGTSPVINFDDPDNPGGRFHFSNKTPFYTNTPGIDWYFALRATGEINIPSPGNYTFGVNSDDGFSLTIGNFNMSYVLQRPDGENLTTFNFPSAGNYPLDFTYFQNTGQAQVEVFSSPGSYSTFNSPGANFQLLGAATVGTVAIPAVPEPGMAMLVVGITLIGLRSRRAMA